MTWRAGGIRPWILQRLTAVYMAVVVVAFTLQVIIAAPSDYGAWQNLLSGHVWNTIIVVFWLSLFAHAWVGVRDVIMDYIHPDGLRFTLLTLFAFYLIAMTSWMLKIMLLAVKV